jgi:hypothetical protein
MSFEMKNIRVFRVKSDNYDCWMSTEAYQSIRLEMSSGDFGAHTKREVWITPNQLEHLKWNRKTPFIDKMDRDDKQIWFFYDGHGDCNLEEVA